VVGASYQTWIFKNGVVVALAVCFSKCHQSAAVVGAMTISSTCAATIGYFYGAAPWLVTSLAIIRGISVIADSPQFSASVTEFSEPDLIGTMLTIQTSIGFLITVLTIHLTPYIVDLVGWRHAFSYLAFGPLLGILAMARLRKLPQSILLSGGNR